MKNEELKEFEKTALELIAIKNYLKQTAESEAKDYNCTKEWLKHAINQLINNMRISWNCNANTRKGKSTAIIKIGKILTEMMKELKQTKEEFGIQNIMRDEQELSQEYTKKSIYRTVRIVDEFRKLDETGLNATTTKALISTISDQNAGQYIHTIRARPIGITDENADMNIIIDSANKTTKRTKAYIYLKIQQNNHYYWIPCGHIILEVKDLIKKWEEIEPEWEKTRKGTATKKDLEIIEKARKEDFYTEYQIRKYQSIDLIQKTGYFRLRDLEQEEIIYKIYERTKEIIELRNKPLKKESVKSEVIDIEKEERLALSILGRNELTDIAYTLLYTKYETDKARQEWLTSEHTAESMFREKYGELLNDGKTKTTLTRLYERTYDEETEYLKEQTKNKEKAYMIMMTKLQAKIEGKIKAIEILRKYKEIMSGKEKIEIKDDKLCISQ